MTLILTELSTLGIAMATDSAVTLEYSTGRTSVQPDGARKLQKVPYLNAGVSGWGMGRIEDIPTDEWLTAFITANADLKDLNSFAEALAVRLRGVVDPSPDGSSRLGFHVAGFEQYDGKNVPSFYHVHDGPSTTLAAKGIHVDPALVNANHDVTPEEFARLVQNGRAWITRNGDYHLYARIFHMLENFLADLEAEGINIPNSQNLHDRVEYLVFQIRTVSDLYRMSNLVPEIGGPIRFLSISPRGIHSEGVSYH